jgi:hypothetical protein
MAALIGRFDAEHTTIRSAVARQPIASVIKMTGTIQRANLRHRRCSFGLVLTLTCSLAASAYADVHVEGTPAAVRVTTSQDSISDVLLAFAAPFKVKYRSAIPLDAAANATYSGSFTQVISRLLDGYNYVIKKDRQTTEIVIFGKRGEVSIPPKEPPAKGILSRWR